MVTKDFCDRCGKEIEKLPLQLSIYNQEREKEEILDGDLCLACAVYMKKLILSEMKIQ